MNPTKFKLVCLVSFLLPHPVLASEMTQIHIEEMATKSGKPASVLKDYVESYNFKCPSPMTHEQLNWLLKDAPYDSDLNIMIESMDMEYRDVYVDARSSIECLTEGQVSKAY